MTATTQTPAPADFPQATLLAWNRQLGLLPLFELAGRLSQQGQAPAERVGAVVAIDFLSWSGPHDLQPCQSLRFSRRARPARQPDRRGR